MATYVMSNRRAGKFGRDAQLASRNVLDNSFRAFAANVELVSEYAAEETSRRTFLFNADPVEMAALARELPDDVILEPEILHWKAKVLPLDLMRTLHQPPGLLAARAVDARIDVNVTGGGVALDGAEVILFLRGPSNLQDRLEGHTDPNGHARFEFSSFYRALGVVVIPAGNFWTMVARGGGGSINVDCPPLPTGGPIAWWHEIMGITAPDESLGEGITVGVVDSGVGPNQVLNHANDIGSFIGGAYDPAGGADSGSHGTHVCGIIGARPIATGQYMGVAPGVSLNSARGFHPGAAPTRATLPTQSKCCREINEPT